MKAILQSDVFNKRNNQKKEVISSPKIEFKLAEKNDPPA